VGANRTTQEREHNRRVDVTIYVTQGVVASGQVTGNNAPRQPGDQIK
jgi:sRNA-binding regulator protein Hfq